MARIGFLGTGEIASAVVETIAGDGHAILVSERSAGMSAALAERFPAVSRAPNERVVAESDVVFVCLLAGTAREVLPGLPFRKGQTVISVMADMPIADLTRHCAPASDICVAIPLPTLPRGGTPLAAYPENPVLRAVLGTHAVLHICPSETALNAHFAVTGLLLPLLDQIATAAGWLSGFTGNRADAESYLVGLLGSFCALAAEEGDPDLDALRNGLRTPGGLNYTLSQKLAEAGTLTALQSGLDGFRDRLHLPE